MTDDEIENPQFEPELIVYHDTTCSVKGESFTTKIFGMKNILIYLNDIKYPYLKGFTAILRCSDK